jgi:putative transposase
MLTGVKFKANPTSKQKLILSQWMGCARFIYNAKVGEEKYYNTFAKKYYPLGVYAPIDQKTAQFKSLDSTSWLSNCPSQILRNSAVSWYQTYQKFIKGACGKPKFKAKNDRGSIHLTREVFRFETCDDGNLRLFIGTKTNNIGYLSFKKHRLFQIPNSLYLRKERGQYFVSFCYENEQVGDALSPNDEHLAFLQGATRKYLEEHTVGVDRGVIVPLHTGDEMFDFTVEQKKNFSKSERYIKRLQRRLAKQTKGSNRRKKTQRRLAKHHAKKANIRQDFAHKSSRTLVDSKFTVFVFEDLKTANMTRKAKPKQDENGRYLSNNAKQKSGLNKAILNVGWFQIALFTQYKAFRIGKAFFKIPASFTSQACAKCDYTHPNNRKSQALFVCLSCGNIDNADENAAKVIKKRAINYILNTGTVLSEKGVLRPKSGIGRGGKQETRRIINSSSSRLRNVKKEKLAA